MQKHERALYAARSYARNRELRPKVEERLAKAQSELESYLLREGMSAVRLGRYQVELRDGALLVTAVPPEGWKQDEIEWEDGEEMRG